MKRTKNTLLAICLLILAAAVISIPLSSAFRKPFATKEFSNPGMKWRPIPLWFWNNTTIEGSTLEEQLEKMIVTDNYGGCAILPFGKQFSPSYLSDDYFRLYGRAVEKAKELGAYMSIYDEYGFPSGSMGAINGSGVTTFMNNHPEHTVKRLDKTEFMVAGGSHPFNYIHKTIDNHHLYYFGNIDASETTNTIILKHSLSSALLMDPHTGNTQKAELQTMEDGLTAVSIHLHPNQSVFLADDRLVNHNGK